MKTIRFSARTRILALSITTMLLTPLAAFAATFTWDGGSSVDSNIATPANWNPDGAPVSDLMNTNLVFAGTVRLTPNFSTVFSANSIAFNNLARGYAFGGSTLTIGSGGIVNNDGGIQTFGNPVTLGTATSVFNTVQGGLAFTGTVAIGANTLTLSGGTAITFSGPLTGVGTITKSNLAPFNFNATATAIGADFNLNAGATTLAATGTTQTFSSGSTLAVNGAATLTLNESATLDGVGALLTRASGAGLTIAAGKTLTIQNGGDAIITGTFTNATASTIIVTGGGSTLQTGLGVIRGGSTLAIQSGGSASASGSLDVGSGTSGTLTVDGAGSTWTQTGASTFTLGASSGSTATLNVQNGGAFTTGTGTTTVNATAHVNINSGTFNANGNVILNGTGAQLNRIGTGVFNLALGNSLTVQNGADATIGGLYEQLVRANLLVTGAGSTFTTAGDFQWEGDGNTLSLLTVSGGGLISVGGAIHLGRFTNNAVSLTVNGAGSQIVAGLSFSSDWQAGVLLVNGASATLGGLRLADVVFGSASSGSLDVQSGSTVSVQNLAAGTALTSATAAIIVDGTGSAITQTGASTFALGASAFSTGALTISNNGTFTSGTGAFTVGATGTVNINGGTLTVNGTLNNSGALNLSVGTLTVNGTLNNSGAFNFSAGTLNLLGSNNLTVGSGGVLGTGLTLLSDRTLNVANTTTIDAARTLALNGGTLRTGALVNNGTLDFQKGTLGITGAGGLDIGTGALGGSVTLGAGANLQVTNTTTIAGGALLRVNGGSFAGSNVTNSGTIDHRDGALNFTGALTNNAGGRIFVSGLASPAGTISNAGTMTLQNGLGFLGGAGAITNTGVITGDGTIAKAVTNSAAGQVRGEAGKTLTFTGAVAANAGTFSLQGGTLEFTTAITNSGTGFISGRGALRTAGLTNEGVLAFSGGTTDVFGDVTNSAGARIVTSGGGAVTTFYDDVIHNGLEIFTGIGASTVFFGAQSGAGSFTGTGTVYYNGDLRPGNSPASVLYEGDLVLGGASTLTLEIGGLIVGAQYDHLNVGGVLTEDGTLDVVLYGGFIPQAGASFDLLDAGFVAGSFDAVNLPALDGGLTWDTSQFAANGIVGVVPEPAAGVLLLGGLVLLGLRRNCR